MAETTDFDHHVSTGLTSTGPSPSTNVNFHHNLTFRTKEMNAESADIMSVDEDHGGQKVEEPGKIAS